MKSFYKKSYIILTLICCGWLLLIWLWPSSPYLLCFDDSFYYFAVTPAGQYAIAEASLAASDVFLTNDDKWEYSDLIAKNADSYQIGADCANGMLTLYVDGQQVASVQDDSYQSGGVALFVWSGEEAASANVSFDEFLMTEMQ